MDRKTELEQKKAKLEQMRQLKLQKTVATAAALTTNKSSSSLNVNGSPNQSNSTSDLTNSNDFDADQILIQCGITTPVLTSSSVVGGSSASLYEGGASEQQLLQHNAISTTSKLMTKNKKQTKLSVNPTTTLEIPPKELVTYSKETQTPATDLTIDKETKPVDYYVLTYDNNADDDEASLVEVSASNNLLKQKDQRNGQNKSNFDFDKQAEDDKSKVQIKEIPDEEKTRITQSDDFAHFISKNTRILERALDQDDIFFDYGGNERNKEIVETGQVLKLSREFYDERWKNRVVTWIDWSPHYPELLLASYEESTHDSDGVAVVWNTKFKTSTPEYIFNCSSWLTSCCFAKFHPNLIIGGTYSGQIVMWDNRSHKRTPIQRSPLSAFSHTHPIYCIQVVGSQNAHNLISISNDGKLCSWTLDNMNTPQETLELQCKQTKGVAATAMAFRPGDVNNFIVGSEEGPIYSSTRHGNKSGINEVFEGHFGPVTGLNCNQVQGPIDFSHLCLSSSFDWSVKLWNIKEPGKPLYSFEHNSDYVYDVAWSPVHPAVFACVDGSGRLDVWNLINDTELPTASILIDGAPALNKLRWSQNGAHIAVGDDQGKISLFDVSESYTQVRSDDWTKFVRVLQDLKENTNELDDGTVPVVANPSVLTSNLGTSAAATMPQQLGIKQEQMVKQEQLTPRLSTDFSNATQSSISPSSTMNLLQQLKAQSPVTPK